MWLVDIGHLIFRTLLSSSYVVEGPGVTTVQKHSFHYSVAQFKPRFHFITSYPDCCVKMRPRQLLSSADIFAISITRRGPSTFFLYFLSVLVFTLFNGRVFCFAGIGVEVYICQEVFDFISFTPLKLVQVLDTKSTLYE